MPTEPADKTKVVKVIPLPKVLIVSLPDLLWDADQILKYENMLNFYNTNVFGYGLLGYLTHYNPATLLEAIQSNFNYAKDNVKTFGELLGTEGMVYAFTPIEIGRGAEAIVTSAPISSKVTKVSTIPRSTMHARNQVPRAVPALYKETSNGLNVYTLNKVHIIPESKVKKATKALEKVMNRRGWKTITHPNLEGVGFTNGRLVVSDIGPGNIGRDWLGRIRLTDFTLESMPEFKIAMEKLGGILFPSFKIY